ncbi:MAG: porin [Rhodoferax sp.]
MATLAATGTSFAQATISGNLGLSWQQNPTIKSDGSHIQGLSMNDGEIYVTATEDLGGGMSATARGGWVMRGRGTAITARDGTVTLKGAFGAVTAGSLRSCGTLVTAQSGVVTGTVYSANESVDQVPLDKCSIVDTVAYSVPVGPVLVTASYGEFAKGESYSSDSTKNWLDSKGNVNGITFFDLDGTYNDGPLMLRMNVTSFSAITNVSTGTTALVPADGVLRTRLVGTYDIGVAKFGLGYQNKTGGSADQYVASIAVPMGNAVFGLDYSARAAQGVYDKGQAGAVAAYALGSARDGDKASSAVGLGVTYNFSKTTSLNASYITYNDAGANSKYGTPTAATYAGITPAGTTAALLDTEYRIRLLKSF